MPEDIGKKLLLLRHAKSAWPDVPDHDRPLARRGRRNAPVMGRWMRAAGHLPDQVLCSTARRARETWQLIQPGLGTSPPVAFGHGIYLVVGHDPAIPELALALNAAAPSAAFDRMRAKFPTAAVAVLQFTGDWNQLASGSARLTCFVTPRDLAEQDGPGGDTT